MSAARLVAVLALHVVHQASSFSLRPATCGVRTVREALSRDDDAASAVGRRSLFQWLAVGGLAVQAAPARAEAPFYCDDAVVWLSNGVSDVYIVGTAHVSNISAILVQSTIDAVEPDLIMVELDAKRIRNFAPPGAAPTPAAAAIKKGFFDGWSAEAFIRKASAAVVGTALKSMYGTLEKMGLDAGQEFAVALSAAQTRKIPVLLADRDVDETLDRLGAALRATDAAEIAQLEVLLGSAVQGDGGGAFTVEMDDVNAVARSVELIKRRSTVQAIVGALREATPELYNALVNERDEVMAANLLKVVDAPSGPRPKRVVCVVGMAHQDGIERRLALRNFKPVEASQKQLCSR
ncbi:TraB family-domain-containing protein [Pelagophyceae sp. CCMP2097]|nr:TraB family-domain-containing protein [Pelagophyceae sp. CCMP2097]